MKKIIQNKYIQFGFLVLLGIWIGWLIKPTHGTSVEQRQSDLAAREQIWTCSMHPQIRRNAPGQCPICGMDLIPLNSENGSDENPMLVAMSPTAMQLASIQTSVVGNQKPVKEIRMTGKVQADERRIYSQASHIPGRIEQLMINYTGEQVQKGQTLAIIYSPALISAQEELFEAMKIKEQQPALFNAARDKLKSWKLTDGQIDQIIAAGKPQEQFPVLADVSGVVLKKRVNTGDYIMKGMSIYDVADLSNLWILFDVYESDMPWVTTHSKVSFTVASVPGETFSGTVSFIDPVINPQTRVAKARVEFPNQQLKLKPEMFASGIITSELRQEQDGLIVPKTAVMWTGKRSVVYVKSNTGKEVGFMMREVTLGPALGDSYVVTQGLEAGEEIATQGTFSIDAAAQLAGKPSMMNPEGGPAMTGHNHAGMTGGSGSMTSDAQPSTTHSENMTISKQVKESLVPLFQDYLALKDALVTDDFRSAQRVAGSLQKHMKDVNMEMFKGDAHMTWMQHSQAVMNALEMIGKAENIGGVRRAFKDVSDHMILMAVAFGPFDREALYIQHCPMANNNKGADWISEEKIIQNPYFGQSMVGCGSVTKEIK
ncbi:MAG: efflux RND transporter periplasmic adaptor subunit [Flavobacteriales bacterium]|nr:efflux RND transporter periplasmic adaptor subunit [Flavobacteriales bacterium]